MVPALPKPHQLTDRRNRRKLAALAAVTCALALGVAACGFDPAREVAPESPQPPADLAFANNDTQTSAAPAFSEGEIAISNGSRAAETVTAGRWRQSLPESPVPVHSGPGTSYTQLGAYEPDDLVLATGQRVDVNGTTWMQISWNETTAWVYEFAFTRTTA